MSIDILGPHANGKKLQRDCAACIALAGFVKHYECSRCFRMIPWCNGVADEIDEAYGGICDDCACAVMGGS